MLNPETRPSAPTSRWSVVNRRTAGGVAIRCTLWLLLAAHLHGATYLVSHTGDAGPGSLRQAILDANATPPPSGRQHRIAFVFEAPVRQLIQPASPLPPLMQRTLVDGTTATGWAANTATGTNTFNAQLMVRLDGSKAGAGVDGLVVKTNGCTLQGLEIGGFSGWALRLEGAPGARLAGNLFEVTPKAAPGRSAGRRAAGPDEPPSAIGAIQVVGSGDISMGGPADARNLVRILAEVTLAKSPMEVTGSPNLRVEGLEVQRADQLRIETIQVLNSQSAYFDQIFFRSPVSPAFLFAGTDARNFSVNQGLVLQTAGSLSPILIPGSPPPSPAAIRIVDGAQGRVGPSASSGGRLTFDGYRVGAQLSGNPAPKGVSLGLCGMYLNLNSAADLDFLVDAALLELGEGGPLPNDPGDGDVGPNDLLNFPQELSAGFESDKFVVRGKLDIPPIQYPPLIKPFTGHLYEWIFEPGRVCLLDRGIHVLEPAADSTFRLALDAMPRSGSQFVMYLGLFDFQRNYESSSGASPPFEFDPSNTENGTEDFGDAPASYGTFKGAGGASHVIRRGFHLGASVDGEPDAGPTNPAGPCCQGDDEDADGPDEDGVSFDNPETRVPSIVYGQLSSVRVFASAPGKLDFWIDFANDGRFDHPGDRVFAWTTPDPNNPLEPRPVVLRAGVNVVYFFMPDQPAPGLTVSNRIRGEYSWQEVRLVSRFRFSSVGGLLPTGGVFDGEVEDHLLAARVEESNRLRYEFTDGGLLRLSWDNPQGVLWESTTLGGDWNSIPGATSPHDVVPNGTGQRYFWLR